MAKVIVTGPYGFVGKHLIKALKAKGHKVIARDYNFRPLQCDIIYHLACPSDNNSIRNHTKRVMDTILDATRSAISICPTALFVNASSMGAAHVDGVDDSTQAAYNVAKRCMELYLDHAQINAFSYRLPAVYGEGMHDDQFIKRCVDGTAERPKDPHKLYCIAHITEVVDALVELRDMEVEYITVGEIYEQFTSGRRGLHRPALNAQAA